MQGGISFLLGHMGGNRILLVDGRSVEEGEHLDLALRMLGGLGLQGHQAGILLPPRDGGHVRVRIVSLSWKDFIPACGGLTQVLGHAWFASDLLRGYVGEAGSEEGSRPIVLETEGGLVSLRLELKDGRVEKVITDMDAFVRRVCRDRPQLVHLDGQSLWKVGSYLVCDGDAFAETGAGSFADLDEATRKCFLRLQDAFCEKVGLKTFNAAVFDRQGRDGGYRALFPHDLRIGHVEASCGTGSTALALALHGMGEPELPTGSRLRSYDFECGGAARLGGGDRLSVSLRLDEEGLPVGGSFWHDRVELVAEGRFRL